jgi:lipoyl(octanoyl) transferase
MQWLISNNLVDYEYALDFMKSYVHDIYHGNKPEIIWLLQHQQIYTAGVSAQPEELLDPKNITVRHITRGGKYTYHGPEQLIIYPMINLNLRGKDLKKYIYTLEEWLIESLQYVGLESKRQQGKIGIWVGEQPKKIAAIGVRITKWVTWHGMALNVSNDLSPFAGIIPCGLANDQVTNMQLEGVKTTIAEMVNVLQKFCPWS